MFIYVFVHDFREYNTLRSNFHRSISFILGDSFRFQMLIAGVVKEWTNNMTFIFYGIYSDSESLQFAKYVMSPMLIRP